MEEEVKKNMSQDETENELYELNKLQVGLSLLYVMALLEFGVTLSYHY